MNYDGPFPYLEATDSVMDTPAYTRELANLLDLPDPASGRLPSGSNVALPVSSTAWATVPNLSAQLSDARPFAMWVLVTFSARIRGVSAAYATFRHAVTDGTGAKVASSAASDYGLHYATTVDAASENDMTLTRAFKLAGGSQPIGLTIEYQAPVGSSMNVFHPRIDIIPLRAG